LRRRNVGLGSADGRILTHSLFCEWVYGGKWCFEVA
jgi:hypothetical protein